MKIHWLGIGNGIIMMLLIFIVFAMIIVRVIRSDLARYLQLPDDDMVNIFVQANSR